MKIEFIYDGGDKNSTGIYKIQIKEHIYVGSSARKGFEWRWKKHLNQLNNKHHHSYKMQKHFDEFQEIKFTIIELCNPDKCIEREQFFIDSLNPDMNIAKIAGSSLGIKRTDKTKERCRQAHLGKKLSKESIFLRSSKLVKKVYQYNLDGSFVKEWNSIKEAGDTLNISRGAISQCSNEKSTSAGGFIWKKEFIEVKPVIKSKLILQFDLNGNLLKEWEGISEIEKNTSFKRNNIYENLRGAKQKAYNFIWKYKQLN